MELDFKNNSVLDYVNFIENSTGDILLLGSDESSEPYEIKNNRQVYADGSTTYITNAAIQIHYNIINSSGFRISYNFKNNINSYYFNKLVITPDVKEYNFFKSCDVQYYYKTKSHRKVYHLKDGKTASVYKAGRISKLHISNNDITVQYTETYSKNGECLLSHIQVNLHKSKKNAYSRLYEMSVSYKTSTKKNYLKTQCTTGKGIEFELHEADSASMLELYNNSSLFNFILMADDEHQQYVYFLLNTFKDEIAKLADERNMFNQYLNVIHSYEKGEF